MTLVQASSSRTILSIDTSQPTLGLALWRGGQLLASVADHSGLPHSQQLFPLLCTCLRGHGVALPEVDLFAVNTGPGSFTGLRVGLAAISGMAATLKKPLLGITALDALAYEASALGAAEVVILLNASRGEVFLGRRRIVADGSISTLGRDRVLPLSQVVEVVNDEVGERETAFIGNGANILWRSLAGNGSQTILAAPEPLAPVIAKWASQQALDDFVASVGANYLRPSDAEIKKQS